MKILVATSGHAPNDDRIFEKEIRSLLDYGHQVQLVTRNQFDFGRELPNFTHLNLRVSTWTRFNDALVSYGTDQSPDLVIVHEFELLPAGARIKKQLGIPLVFDVHEAHAEMYDAFSSRPAPMKQLINWGLLAFERLHLGRVDLIIVAAHTLFERYNRRGIATVLVPNFPRLTGPLPELNRENIIIYQGQVSTERGIHLLVKAFKSIAETSADARLEIIGPERRSGTLNQLQTLASQFDLSDRITISGPQPRDFVLQRLQHAKIGTVPFPDSPFTNSLVPIKLFEYMQAGCAVVASELAGITTYGRSLVELVPPGDWEALAASILHLITNDRERKSLARSGHIAVTDSLNWQKVEPTYIQALEGLA
jgi:glycosyltransferase involved in cell wall biosynthesis